MAFLDRYRSKDKDLSQLYSEGGDIVVQALSDLPTVPTPKAPTKSKSIASYRTTVGKTTSAIPKSNTQLANTDFNTLREGSTKSQTIRNFAKASPNLAAAVFAYLRTGITNSYVATAKTQDGVFDPEATKLLQQIINRMDVLPDYTQGFTSSKSLQSISEMLGKEIMLDGAMALELVLDKQRIPSRLQPIHSQDIEFIPDGNDLKPVQRRAGVAVDLDIPTFFYVSLDQDLTTPYSDSPIEPAIRPTAFAEDFMQDLWRVVKRAIHPRQNVEIDWKMIQDMIPEEAAHDENATTEFLDNLILDVTNQINGLGPEDALVHFDFISVNRDTAGNVSTSDEYDTLQSIANAQIASGSKALPAILGHPVGSSNTASTESMLFVKSAAGAIQVKLNEIYSRAFTLALRLYGLDVTAEFKYAEINLRPDLELEAFKSQKQSRILELLSLGLITDEQASMELTGKLPPEGFTPLTGTFFTVSKMDPSSLYNGESNSGSTLNQNLEDKPKTGNRGSNTKNGNV